MSASPWHYQTPIEYIEQATYEHILEKDKSKGHAAGLCGNRSTESTFSNLHDETHMVFSLVGGADGGRRV